MIIYIPQNIDPYNTHLKNLIDEYVSRKISIIVGYDLFLNGDIVPDIIHFHHIGGLLSHIDFNEELFFERLDYFKSNNVKFLYTAHNVYPHTRKKNINYKDIIARFLAYSDIIIHHGKSSIAILRDEFPVVMTKKNIICHHGDYTKDMANFNVKIISARNYFGIRLEKKVILVFGQLHYKNTPFVRTTFGHLKSKYKDAYLVMAGVNAKFSYSKLNTFFYKINNKVLNKLRSDRIFIYKRFSQYETYLLFISADLIFLPHSDGLTTGIIPLSATLGKPFVYPDIGVFEEQAEYCIAEKYKSENSSDAVNAIDKILKSGANKFDNSKWLLENTWKKHVDNIFSNL